MTCGTPPAVRRAVLRSIHLVRTMCPRWTPPTMQGGVRLVFRTIERRRRCSRFWDTPLPRHSSPPTPRCCISAPSTPRRPPTTTAASPPLPRPSPRATSPPPPLPTAPSPHQARRRDIAAANSPPRPPSDALLPRMILGRPLYAGLRCVEPDLQPQACIYTATSVTHAAHRSRDVMTSIDSQQLERVV